MSSACWRSEGKTLSSRMQELESHIAHCWSLSCIIYYTETLLLTCFPIHGELANGHSRAAKVRAALTLKAPTTTAVTTFINISYCSSEEIRFHVNPLRKLYATSLWLFIGQQKV